MTQNQIDRIVSIIHYQCDRIVERNNRDSAEFPDLIDDDYCHMRGHVDTAAIYAGFQPGMDIAGLSVEKHKYDRGHYQPDIGNEEIIVQIYSNDASLRTEEVEAKKADLRHYYIFKFYQGKNGRLTQVVLIDMATEVEREVYNFRNELKAA